MIGGTIMKLYLVIHIIDRKPYIVTVCQSKDIAIKHAETACTFIRGDNLEILKKGDDICWYYKGEPRYAVTACEVNFELNEDGTIKEVSKL